MLELAILNVTLLMALVLFPGPGADRAGAPAPRLAKVSESEHRFADPDTPEATSHQ